MYSDTCIAFASQNGPSSLIYCSSSRLYNVGNLIFITLYLFIIFIYVKPLHATDFSQIVICFVETVHNHKFSENEACHGGSNI
jgi:hypothetical protein